jgi:hypothetical protein
MLGETYIINKDYTKGARIESFEKCGRNGKLVIMINNEIFGEYANESERDKAFNKIVESVSASLACIDLSKI